MILSHDNDERTNDMDQGSSREWCQTDLTVCMMKETTQRKRTDPATIILI